MPLQLRRPHFDVGHRLGAGGAMIHDAQVRAHQRQDVEQAGARRIHADTA